MTHSFNPSRGKPEGKYASSCVRASIAAFQSALAGGAVLTRAKLRDTLAVKNERLGQALESLERAGRRRGISLSPDKL